MCGIAGIIPLIKGFNLHHAISCNAQRGRDAWGVFAMTQGRTPVSVRNIGPYDGQDLLLDKGSTAILNLRAEPTTEYVQDKQISDVQPYTVGHWTIVHNGTIANDKDLCRKYNLKPPTRIDSWVIAALLDMSDNFGWTIRSLVGSYAIMAIDDRRPDTIFFAMNYRPLYFHKRDAVIALSSVPLAWDDALLTPYSYGSIDARYGIELFPGGLYRKVLEGNDEPTTAKALVVFSGGLDSTVAAATLQAEGYAVELLHFDYGARATGPERQAVELISAKLNVPLHVIDTDVFTKVIKGSRLTNTKTETFADGEAGAEYAHEWVPARNLILTSIALGIAESRDFDVLALGANLEEAGAYPDNEPEFLRQFGKLIPFAVGDGKRIRIETPVGNLMKHEIVALGLKVNAPMELSWSCYDAQLEFKDRIPLDPELTLEDALGQGLVHYRHCGKCGPCFMRRTAFEINGREDPVFAAIEVPTEDIEKLPVWNDIEVHEDTLDEAEKLGEEMDKHGMFDIEDETEHQAVKDALDYRNSDEE